MEIASIKGGEVYLVYMPAEHPAPVGTLFSLLEQPDRERGLIVMVLENSTLDLEGMMLGQVQHLLEERLYDTQVLYSQERGLDAVRHLKVARCSVLSQVREGGWEDWNGWIPTRNVAIESVAAERTLAHAVPKAEVPLRPFARVGKRPVGLDAACLGLCTCVLGNKGGGKSHTLKHLALAMTEWGVPVVIFDLNGEYHLPGFQVLRLGQNYKISLSEQGWGVLSTLVETICPLQAGSPSEAAFNAALPKVFKERREECKRRGQPFTLDLSYLQQISWSGNNYVSEAISERLERLTDMGVFAEETDRNARGHTPLSDYYEAACQEKRPIVFDLDGLGHAQQQALVRSALKSLSRLCDQEHEQGTQRYCQIIADEAHLYLKETDLMGLISRARHIGAGLFLGSNSPDRLPESALRLVDNLILMPVSHRDDLRAVAKAAAPFCDEATLTALVTRLKRHHALILGSLTNRWPLVVEIDPLPEGIPSTGVTRSAWARFAP